MRFASIAAAIPLSCGGMICAPLSQYTLYPLSAFGLCEAVIMIPATQPRARTQYETSGVWQYSPSARPGSRITSKPRDASASAARHA